MNSTVMIILAVIEIILIAILVMNNMQDKEEWE